MIRSEIANGISLEGRILCAMQHETEALDATEVAALIDDDPSRVWEVLERLYFSSKLEKRNGLTPIYRIPGKENGKLSLPN